jgi:hypothetical protein
MAAGKPSPRALTINFGSRKNVLRSIVKIGEAFEPKDQLVEPTGNFYDCIWDTGASCSVITSKVIKDLSLQPTGKAVCYTAGGPKIQNTYLVSIGLPNEVVFTALKVVEGEVEGTDALIGMDIISRGDFAVTNNNGITIMSYQWPSNHEINFVDEISRKKLIPEHHEMNDNEKRQGRNKRKRDRKKRR